MKSKHLPSAFDSAFSILMNIHVEPKFKLKNSSSKEGPQLKWDLLHFIRMPCLSPFWSVIFSVFSQPHSKYSDISVFVRAVQIRYIKSNSPYENKLYTNGQLRSITPSDWGLCWQLQKERMSLASSWKNQYDILNLHWLLSPAGNLQPSQLSHVQQAFITPLHKSEPC